MRRPTYDSDLTANGGWLVKVLAAALVVLVTVVTLVSSVPAYSQRGTSPPRLVLERPRHDFGETSAGEDLTHAFWVQNIGAGPLEMSDRPLLTTRPTKVGASVSLREPRWRLMAAAVAPAPT